MNVGLQVTMGCTHGYSEVRSFQDHHWKLCTMKVIATNEMIICKRPRSDSPDEGSDFGMVEPVNNHGWNPWKSLKMR